jgi:hypothetical protein
MHGPGGTAPLARAAGRASGRSAVLRHQRTDASPAQSSAAARADLRRTAVAAGVRRRFAPHQLRHAPCRRDGSRRRATVSPDVRLGIPAVSAPIRGPASGSPGLPTVTTFAPTPLLTGPPNRAVARGDGASESGAGATCNISRAGSGPLTVAMNHRPRLGPLCRHPYGHTLCRHGSSHFPPGGDSPHKDKERPYERKSGQAQPTAGGEGECRRADPRLAGERLRFSLRCAAGGVQRAGRVRQRPRRGPRHLCDRRAVSPR